MKTAAIVCLAILLPVQAPAQTGEPTLKCQYERAWATDKAEEKMVGEFSAIVRIIVQTPQAGLPTATVETSGLGCDRFVGQFNELVFTGTCVTEIGLRQIFSLFIDRISGKFTYYVIPENVSTMYTYKGRCTLSKKRL